MSETPTPRTDAECFVNEGDFVTGDFARQLERELSAAKREVEELSRSIRQHQLMDEEILGLRERIRRLTEAGDSIIENGSVSERLLNSWQRAKETRP